MALPLLPVSFKRSVALLLLTAALFVLPAAARAQTKPAAAKVDAPRATPTLRDRVLAVVDEDPILESDLQRVLGLGLAKPNPGESQDALRRRVLDTLIAERLRFHEIERYGFGQVPVPDIEKQVGTIRAGFADDAAFNARLKALGLDLAALRQLVARQLEVLTYVDERLGPQVFVSLDDIANYYRTVLTPEMTRQHLPTPPLDDVREKIREVLRQQHLTQELERWTEELRRKAKIEVYLDHPENAPLPPLVKRYDKTPPGQSAAPRKPAPPSTPATPPPPLRLL
jgi:hypothetical protein